MDRKKRYYRLLPVDIYNTDALEKYLADMAGRGYFLTGIGSFTARFEKREPEKPDYLMVPLSKKEKEPDLNERQRLLGQGWNYVCTAANLFHIYVSTGEQGDAERPEISSESYTVTCLKKRVSTSRYLVPFFLAATAMLLCALLLNPRALRFMVKDNFMPFTLWYVLYVIYMIWTLWYDRHRLKRLTGRNAKPDIPKKAGRIKVGYMICGFHSIILLSSFAMTLCIFYGLGSRHQENLWEYQGQIPAVSLAQIEQNPSLKMEQDSFSSRITYEWSLLAPEQLKIDERAENLDASLHTQVYQLRFKAMAEPLMNELIGYYGYQFNLPGPICYEELFDLDYDRVVYIKSEYEQQIFAVNGHRMVYVSYHGDKDLKAAAKTICQTSL